MGIWHWYKLNMDLKETCNKTINVFYDLDLLTTTFMTSRSYLWQVIIQNLMMIGPMHNPNPAYKKNVNNSDSQTAKNFHLQKYPLFLQEMIGQNTRA